MNLTGQTTRQRQPREEDRKYLDSFRGTACEGCGADDGTTVPAHMRWGLAGGMSYKPHDYLTAGLCMKCHDIADHGIWRDRVEIWLRVLKKIMLDRYRAWQEATL